MLEDLKVTRSRKIMAFSFLGTPAVSPHCGVDSKDGIRENVWHFSPRLMGAGTRSSAWDPSVTSARSMENSALPGMVRVEFAKAWMTRQPACRVARLALVLDAFNPIFRHRLHESGISGADVVCYASALTRELEPLLQADLAEPHESLGWLDRRHAALVLGLLGLNEVPVTFAAKPAEDGECVGSSV
jgi:hypothetical protein